MFLKINATNAQCLTCTVACKVNLMHFISNNLLLTEHKGRTGEYWPEVVAVGTKRRKARTQMSKGQCSSVWLEQARLVGSLLYTCMALILAAN